MVRAFAHGAMGRWIDPSWGGPIELFPLLLIGKSSLCGGSGFLSHYQNGPYLTICLTPYNRK